MNKILNIACALLALKQNSVRYANCSEDVENAGRELQAAGMSSLYEEDGCQCQDPQGGLECYEPVCPAGHYKCCFNCAVSLCAEGETKVNNLVLSYRGIFECLECAHGDYCPGCDQFAECPVEIRLGDRGEQKPTPRISAAGSVEERNCKRCPFDYEAALERDRCENPWREACNVHRMEVCVAGCKTPSDECERMACKIYCSSQQGEKCLAAFQEDCETLNAPYFELDQRAADGQEDGAGGESDEQPLILSDDEGKAEYQPPRTDKPCNNDCNNCDKLAVNILYLGVLVIGQFLRVNNMNDAIAL